MIAAKIRFFDVQRYGYANVQLPHASLRINYSRVFANVNQNSKIWYGENITRPTMKTTVLISRLLLGFLYLVFGLDYFIHFLPQPPLHTGAAGAFKAGLYATGYFYPIMKVVEVLGGLSLLTNRYAAFWAVVLFPISFNVFMFHTVLVPSGFLMGVFLLLPNLLLGIGWWPYYKPMFTQKTTV